MKNKISLAVLVLSVTALFSSCLDIMFSALDQPSTHKIVLDEYSPDDRNITLTYSGALVLKRWNGSDMMNVMYNSRSVRSIDKMILTLPAGDNRFIFDVYIIFDKTFSYTSYRVPNVELSYSLEAGKKYQIKTRAKKRDFFMGLYDVTKRSTLLQEWKIGRR